MFVEGQVYKRSEIHDRYGGNRQSGICPSATNPYIFIFTGASGNQYGYKDEWLNEDIFSYTGEGQVGDMQFTKGNLALRDHLINGKRVFLFEYIAKGTVEYINELGFLDCDYFETHDTNGKVRMGIKFFFKREATRLYEIPDELNFSLAHEENEPYGIRLPNKTERKGLVTSRVGQGAYRKSILHRWKYKCAVTAFNNPKVLIASHILPWKESTHAQRLDVDNGILLSPTYDALFDKKLISFDETGKIMLSKELKKYSYDKIKVTGEEKIVGLREGNQCYLERHRLLL
ncbi:hypothetical protein FNH22_18950 [Fulvivirga sp. M361]|uniref:HNH endonuclease n=1 Tax=Fulvivirga sp. M361 TaxID=2594266 RepID=UPI00117B73EC|nr:HNH endonuclease [Fulvivirga sp. M361]TRX54834.1 hypothetical protein FNH22_18950 [Fulvivirga sp. M361]